MDGALGHDAEIVQLLLGVDQEGALGILLDPCLGQDGRFNKIRGELPEQGTAGQQRKILAHSVTSQVDFQKLYHKNVGMPTYFFRSLGYDKKNVRFGGS